MKIQSIILLVALILQLNKIEVVGYIWGGKKFNI